MVGVDHFGENVGGRKGNLGHRGLRRRPFHRQRVFELMRKLAQLPQSTGCRVAFQRVHRAADAAHDLFVARMLLQLQGFVIQRLQQFLRGLVKQVPQFRAAFIVGMSHSRTSTR